MGWVASCIETASATWFERGPLVPALLASAAAPGHFGPVVMEGRHDIDGGLVDSIPLAQAVERGARTIFVLHVGRHQCACPCEPDRRQALVRTGRFHAQRPITLPPPPTPRMLRRLPSHRGPGIVEGGADRVSTDGYPGRVTLDQTWDRGEERP